MSTERNQRPPEEDAKDAPTDLGVTVEIEDDDDTAPEPERAEEQRVAEQPQEQRVAEQPEESEESHDELVDDESLDEGPPVAVDSSDAPEEPPVAEEEPAAAAAEPASSPAPRLSIADASAEDCFEEAQRLLSKGNEKLARQLLQVAIAKAPTKAEYREALTNLHGKHQRQVDQAARLRKDLEEDAERAPSPPAPTASPHAYLVKPALMVALMALCGLTAAISLGLFDSAPRFPTTDVSPYLEVSLVVERASQGPAPTDLRLTVSEEWASVPDKEALVHRLADAASKKGFHAVTVLAPDGEKVASTRNNGKTVAIY